MLHFPHNSSQEDDRIAQTCVYCLYLAPDRVLFFAGRVSLEQAVPGSRAVGLFLRLRRGSGTRWMGGGQVGKRNVGDSVMLTNLR